MFGSDYPFWEAQAATDTVSQAGLSPAVRSAIDAQNAARLFGLGRCGP